MQYIHTPAREASYTVSFWGGTKNKHLFEPGANEDEYFLSQDVKSWLVKNDIKVFVTYGCGDWGGGVPEFSIEFQSESDAKLFIEHWNTK